MKKLMMIAMVIILWITASIGTSASSGAYAAPMPALSGSAACDRITCTMSISPQGRLKARCSIISRSQCNEIRINMRLQKYMDGQWIKIKNWSSTKYNSFAYMRKSKWITEGCYRLKCKITVYHGTEKEVKNLVSDEQYYY